VDVRRLSLAESADLEPVIVMGDGANPLGPEANDWMLQKLIRELAGASL